MDYSDSIGPCPFCRSTKYSHTETGFLVCEYGHQSQKFWQEEQDDFDTNVGVGKRLKKAKTVSSQIKLSSEADIRHDTPNVIKLGDVDRFNLILALQHVLQAQTNSISQYFGLGDDFEVKVKNIWLMFISTMPLDYDEEEISTVQSTDKSLQSISTDHNLNLDILESQNSNDLLSFVKIPFPSNSQYFGIYKELTKISPKTLFVIIYLGLIEVGLPIVLADIRRMAFDGIIPCGDTRAFIQPKTRKCLESLKWDIIFKASKYPVPSMEWLRMTTGKITFQLAVKGNTLLRPLNLSECLEPLITQLIKLYKIPTSYYTGKGVRSRSPELDIMASILFFLNIHYSLISPSKIGKNDKYYIKIGLPPSKELLQLWSRKRSRVVFYEDIVKRDTFSWTDLPNYLKYCDGIQHLGRSEKVPPKNTPFQRMYIFDEVDDIPIWRDAELDSEKLEMLRLIPKIWVDSSSLNLDEMSEEFRLILRLACIIIDEQESVLLERMNRKFETFNTS